MVRRRPQAAFSPHLEILSGRKGWGAEIEMFTCSRGACGVGAHGHTLTGTELAILALKFRNFRVLVYVCLALETELLRRAGSKAYNVPFPGKHKLKKIPWSGRSSSNLIVSIDRTRMVFFFTHLKRTSKLFLIAYFDTGPTHLRAHVETKY